MIRAAIKINAFGASAHPIDAIMNPIIPNRNALIRPIQSPSLPPMATHEAIANK